MSAILISRILFYLQPGLRPKDHQPKRKGMAALQLHNIFLVLSWARAEGMIPVFWELLDIGSESAWISGTRDALITPFLGFQEGRVALDFLWMDSQATFSFLWVIQVYRPSCLEWEARVLQTAHLTWGPCFVKSQTMAGKTKMVLPIQESK